jgi:hypothetical protein
MMETFLTFPIDSILHVDGIIACKFLFDSC